MSVYYFYAKSDAVPFVYFTSSRMVGEIPPPYESKLSASDYVEFALADLDEGSARGLVNAFGNAKRALHLAIDTLLHQYGLFEHFKRANFPRKLKLLDEVGALPITVMRNLNVERNAVEHEYTTPSEARVKEAVDVARLLLLATEKLVESTPHEAVVGWKNPKRHLVLRIEPFRGAIDLYTLRARGQYRRIEGVSCFTGNLRNFRGDLNAKVTIPRKPWRTIKLDRGGMPEWRPIISEFLRIQRRASTSRCHLDRDQGIATMSVKIPLPDLGNMSWSDLLERAAREHGKKAEERAETR